jgi:hypothetical protein
MDVLIASGCGCLGLLIGGLAALYVVRSERLTLGVLSGAVSILSGAGVVAIFHTLGNQQDPPPREYWVYPIGLFVGAGVIGLFKGKAG